MVIAFLVIVLVMWVASPTTQEIAAPGVYAFLGVVALGLLFVLVDKITG